MPPTVPVAAPTAPPTMAPTGPAALSPAAAPSSAPRKVPCAYAVNGKLTMTKVATARIFVLMIAPSVRSPRPNKYVSKCGRARHKMRHHVAGFSMRIAGPRSEQIHGNLWVQSEKRLGNNGYLRRLLNNPRQQLARGELPARAPLRPRYVHHSGEQWLDARFATPLPVHLLDP